MDYNTILKNNINVIEYKHDYVVWSAECGYYKVVRVLLQNGANIHVNNDDSALKLSAFYGHYDIVKMLLNNGANAEADGYQALEWAKEQGHTDIVQLLEEHIARLRNGL